ncbi:hypothetical protein X759_27605 [Mesorhizobium sp. LSHC420B00]|nr:hypothetical protein X759_27605 [Mesorhizobium sp. LSHC420B00]
MQIKALHSLTFQHFDIDLLVECISQRWRYLARVHDVARRLVDKHGASRASDLAKRAAARASGRRGAILRAVAESVNDLMRLDIFYH